MYRIVSDPAIAEQVAALPDEALLDFAEVLSALEVSPWSGEPQHEGNPDGAVRRWAFGRGMAGHVVYLIIDREVHLLMVQWLG
ncbi:hypothetical protein IU474_23075 [Nocardia otitidiscaviarum]|uniref:hypothetical protein n=1 Tax=Nocardia otitidiscaviarum TaxID=1823 RepID=UPI001894FBA8|nr:hypothetical protein [Nocardia otitidiscaviarum]MBF6239936.1 hypothetical protein [Nocardia otitidiscaviarum]